VGEYTVIQEPDGRLHALRHGQPWREMLGDNLVLSLAQEVERLREQLEYVRLRLVEVGSDPDPG
jgi:hypothetical protein